MAPDSPKRKRKRGHLPDANGAANDATPRGPRSSRTAVNQEDAPERDDYDDSARPRKRLLKTGRPPGHSASGGGQNAQTAAASKRTKARDAPAPEDAQDGDGSAQPRRSTRDRNSGDGTPWWTVSDTHSASKPSPKEVVGPPAEKRRRGRPSLKEISVDDVQNQRPSSPADAEPKKKRGRPSLSKETADTAVASQPKKKRGRPSLQREVVNESADGQPKRKRGRPSLQREAVDESVDGQPKRKRGRPSLQKEAADAPAPKRRRGRPSLEEQSQARPEASGTARKGRPRRSDGPSDVSESHTRSGRQSAGEASTAAGGGSRGKKQATAGRRQRQPDELREEGTEPEDVATQADSVLLQQTQQSVSRSTIAQKWMPLDGGAISAVAAILAEAELPVLVRSQDWQGRREQARSVLSIISRRLRSKLVKGMPFPPATSASRSTSDGARSGHQEDLDFEQVVNSAQVLEDQLDPLQHSVALLRREKDKEEKQLENDYAELRTLETNARAEARTWRDRIKKAHVLAPGAGKETSAAAGSRDLQIVLDVEAKPGAAFQGLVDEDLVSLATQIGSHMESMRGNLDQIEGVVPAVVESRAALQDVLHGQLDARQYEQLVLG